MVMVQTDCDAWECPTCGAGAGWWSDDEPPKPWELVCSDCLLDLHDELCPDDDDGDELDALADEVERALGRPT
jgi:hypothetical protein